MAIIKLEPTVIRLDPIVPDPLPRAHSHRRSSTMAIISVIAGVLGWTLLPFVGSIAAIITGHMARGEIKRSNGQIGGDGLAIGGLALGYAVVALTVLSIIAVILFFGGLSAFIAVVSNWG